MAIRKVLGTETEFGIAAMTDPEFNPALASAAVVNACPLPGVRVQWSHDEETPDRDARSQGHESFGITDPQRALVNAVLANGARLYVDHAHPEYSTPECYDPLEAALHDQAGVVVAHRSAQAASERTGHRLALYKNNSDGKGNSYGSHENYLLDRQTPFGTIIRYCLPFFVSRQIFTGSGKVGSENGRPNVDYQITQRADFFEEEVGLETTLKRPIVNTRDEPHGEPSRFRRLHVIIGDANLSDVQIYLKLGVTALFLAAMEDGAIPDPLDLADPVEACWRISHDVELREPVKLLESGSATAIEIQMRYHEWLTAYAQTLDDAQDWQLVLDEWESVLADLEIDPELASDRLDWVAKRSLLRALADRHGLEPQSARMRTADLQYHDVDPERSLHQRLLRRGRVRRLFTDEEIEAATTNPPTRTRAYFRGETVRRFSDSVAAANWDALVFDTGEKHLKRVPMMDPLRGDKARTERLLDEAEDVVSLLEALGGTE